MLLINKQVTMRFAICLVSCFWCAVPAKKRTKEMPVSYPTIHANFQRNGRIDAVCTAAGKIDWFVAVPNPPRTLPQAIVTDGTRWYVSYHNLLLRLGTDGSIIWLKEIQSRMVSMISAGLVYHSNGANVYRIDEKQQPQGLPLFVPYCGPRGQILFLAPLPGNTHIVQTFELDEEPMPGQKPRNIWSLSLLDDSGTDLWSNEYSKLCAPAVMNSDLSVLVLPFGSGTVLLLDPKTGKERFSFTLKERGIRQVSLDGQGNILIFGSTIDGAYMLIKCDQKGAVNWEHRLPSAQPRAFMQPPAVDNAGRVYIIHADTLFCFNDKGVEQWANGIICDPDFEYVTVLGDNGVLVSSGNMLRMFASDGSTRFTVWLAAGERISTPAVVDREGRIMVGTAKGIYRIK